MKTVTILCALFYFLKLVVAEDIFTAQEQNCIAEFNLDRNQIKSILNEESNYLPEDNSQFSEFLSCYWKKVGYQNEDGTISYDSLIELIKDFPRDRFGGSFDGANLGLQIATDVVDSCRNILQGNSHGQTAAKTQNCITRQIEEYVEED